MQLFSGKPWIWTSAVCRQKPFMTSDPTTLPTTFRGRIENTRYASPICFFQAWFVDFNALHAAGATISMATCSSERCAFWVPQMASSLLHTAASKLCMPWPDDHHLVWFWAIATNLRWPISLCTNELHIMSWVTLIVLRQMHSSILHGLIYVRHLANAWRYVVSCNPYCCDSQSVHLCNDCVTAKTNKPQTCFGCPTRCQTELHAHRQSLSGTPSHDISHGFSSCANHIVVTIDSGVLAVFIAPTDLHTASFCQAP